MIIKIRNILVATSLIFSCTRSGEQKEPVVEESFWAPVNLLTPFRLPLPVTGTIEYLDLDKDGDPDLLRYLLPGDIPVQWIDDDDDMQVGDLEGDMDSDCLMVDVNRDGEYGNGHDLMLDWNDEDLDGNPDMQVLAENGAMSDKGQWNSHFMILMDTDGDNILHYIDWNSLKIEGWEHEGRSKFFEDYHGESLMIKAHTSTFNIKDLRFSWENPFLFYDEDCDGYSEMAIRLVDKPNIQTESDPYSIEFSKRVTLAQVTIDLDNDNGPSNELDYDMSLKFYGDGFDYSDQVHKFNSLRGLPESDRFFHDPRWRQLTELIYTGHDSAYNHVFSRGKWDGCWFVFDEDDDCQRWERVEFYEPLDPFKAGSRQGGLDDHPQADVSGDRGEWDMDFSGRGQLYISPLDGKLHLYGAESGYWRIDQFAEFFQGWQGWRGGNLQPEDHIFVEPEIFPTVKYMDTDGNGFLDKIGYDLDGDREFERFVSASDLGVDDSAEVIDISDFNHTDFQELFTKVAEQMWANASEAVSVYEAQGFNSNWYAFLMDPTSLWEKYSYGYWLSYYINVDLNSIVDLRD